LKRSETQEEREMPRVLVVSDDGEMLWNERVNQSDFEGEHFRRCLADRLGWAVADAEMLSTPPDVTALRRERGGRGVRTPVQRSKIAA
jgi:hypothetical protein